MPTGRDLRQDPDLHAEADDADHSHMGPSDEWGMLPQLAARAGPGPHPFPPEIAVWLAQRTGAVAVVGEAAAHLDFDRRAGCRSHRAHHVTSDADGLHEAVEHARAAHDDSGPPWILAVGLRGRDAQSLLHACEAAALDAVVLLAGEVTGPEPTCFDCPTLMATAARLWGSRVAQRVHELTCLGQPVPFAGPRGPSVFQLAAAAVRIRSVPLRRLRAPHVLCRPHVIDGERMHVLATEGANLDIVPILERALGSYSGAHTWDTHRLRPGREAGMQDAATDAVYTHTHDHVPGMVAPGRARRPRRATRCRLRVLVVRC